MNGTQITDISMKTDKLKRRLKFLMSNLQPNYLWEMSPEYVEKYISKDQVGTYNKIYSICNILKLDRESVDKLWSTTHLDRVFRCADYSKNHPTVMKKDNKDVKVLGNSFRGQWMNTIRVPKKCRKTAWKRFYKLFPDRKPKVLQ